MLLANLQFVLSDTRAIVYQHTFEETIRAEGFVIQFLLPSCGNCNIDRKDLNCIHKEALSLKISLSCHVKFLTTENSLKLMEKFFFFFFMAFLALRIFKFLPWLFCYVEKGLDKKTKVNFKIYDVTDWTKNN